VKLRRHRPSKAEIERTVLFFAAEFTTVTGCNWRPAMSHKPGILCRHMIRVDLDDCPKLLQKGVNTLTNTGTGKTERLGPDRPSVKVTHDSEVARRKLQPIRLDIERS